MLRSQPRVAAVVLTTFLALLAALATGMVAQHKTCRTISESPPAKESDSSRVPQDNPGQRQNPSSEIDESQQQENPFSQQDQPQGGGGGAGGSQVQVVAAAMRCSTAFSPSAASTGLAGALVTGLAVIVLFSIAARRKQVSQPGSPAVGLASRPVTAIDASHSERMKLIQALIYVRDRATSVAIAKRVGEELHDIGVEEINPVGVAFDPSKHEAGGTTATTNLHQDGLVAATETVGYTDRGRLLRAPVVTVLRYQGQQR